MEDVDLDTQLNVFEDEALADEELLLENLNLEDLAFGYPRRDRGTDQGGDGLQNTPSLTRPPVCVRSLCVLTSPDEVFGALMVVLKDTDSFPFFVRTLQDMLLIPGPRRRRSVATRSPSYNHVFYRLTPAIALWGMDGGALLPAAESTTGS